MAFIGVRPRTPSRVTSHAVAATRRRDYESYSLRRGFGPGTTMSTQRGYYGTLALLDSALSWFDDGFFGRCGGA